MAELVSPDNFSRAESDAYFSAIAHEGGFGRFVHYRELEPVDRQTVVRSNRDTLYSTAVFDLDAGDVRVTLPDAGKRFLSLMVIDEDQYAVKVVYGRGTYAISRDEVGTRYTMVGVRILVDPRDPHDLAAVHALQDAIRADQPSAGRFEIPAWDAASQARVRDALVALGATIHDSHRMFGARDEVDPIRHLIGTAVGWGGNPEKDAVYHHVTPDNNDGATIYRLTVRDVPVDGFWSVSVYNARGYFEPNDKDAYSVNNLTAKRDADGSVTIQFGGFAPDANCLPVTPGWTYTVRMYLPREEIIAGKWTFPPAEAITPTFLETVDVVTWATPIVSFEAMRDAFFRNARARYNDIVYWSQPADWRVQLTTPNASTRYVYFNFNTANGPVVLDVPPAVGAGLYGSLLDAWQVPVVDVGPQGEDGGRGGRYVILPPGDRTTEIVGAIPVRPATVNGYGLLRAIAEDASPAAVDRALDLVRGLQLYQAVQIDEPPVTHSIDMTGQLFDGIVRYDDTFFERLARILDEEAVPARDAGMKSSLAAIGIERGRRFAPDPDTRLMLGAAARSAYTSYVEAAMTNGPLQWPHRRWRAPNAIGAQTAFTFETDRGLDLAARGLIYFLACAPPARLGKGALYFATHLDRNGERLAGDRMYRLRVPRGAPARQFWALTVYDAATAAFFRQAPRLEVSSYARDLAIAVDGAVDIYVGPRAPGGVPTGSWIATGAGRRWFAFFRLYAPTAAIADGSWVLPDFEPI